MKTLMTCLAVAAFLAVVGSSSKAMAFEEIVNVVDVGCEEGGQCFIGISPALSSSNTSCTNRSVIRLESGWAGSASIHKTALAAFLSGKRIKVNPWWSPCVQNSPRPQYVVLIN